MKDAINHNQEKAMTDISDDQKEKCYFCDKYDHCEHARVIESADEDDYGIQVPVCRKCWGEVMERC